MKAVLLNSGMGTRLDEYTKKLPKCLIPVGDRETILSRQVKVLLDHGITDIVITTGHLEDKIRYYLRERFPAFDFVFVHNSLYDRTNYIYSLLLAEDELDDDIVLLHGDLVFAPSVLQKLLSIDEENGVVVNAEANLPEKDFKAEIRSGRVRKIATGIFSPDCYFLLPMYRFSLASMRQWVDEMKLFQQQGYLQSYAETALNNILERLELYPVYISDELCMEIDNLEDLQKVSNLLRKASSEGEDHVD